MSITSSIYRVNRLCSARQALSRNLWRPLLPYGYSYMYMYKASCVRPGRAVICNFDVRALTLSLERQCPDVKSYKWRPNPVWYRVLYSCIHMATVGVKGLTSTTFLVRSVNNDRWRKTTGDGQIGKHWSTDRTLVICTSKSGKLPGAQTDE